MFENKKGAERELWKIVLAVVILVIMVGAVILLLKGKGLDEVWGMLRDIFRFGRPKIILGL